MGDLKYDLIIKGGTLVDPQGSVRGRAGPAASRRPGPYRGMVKADLGIARGKIAAIADEIEPSRGRELYDASGRHVLPGLIDAHVHFRDPGLTCKEDFASGSAAAAYGGITLVADMPNTLPPTAGPESFGDKARIAGERSYTDFSLFALLTEDNLGDMEALCRAGALGFKVFLGASVGNLPPPGAGTLYEQMKRAAAGGRRIAFHAEHTQLNEHFTRLCREAAADPALLPRARPDISEAEAVAQAIRFSAYTGAKIHICHVSARRSLALIRKAKGRGLPVSAETCPQYLFFDSADYPRLGTRIKANPPVRDPRDREALWRGLADGTIDLIASDHAPHSAEEKDRPLWEALPGIIGVETSVPLMLSAVNRGRLCLADYVRAASLAPARVWGLYPQKGSFTLNTDADFTIVDMEKTGRIRREALHSKHPTSPYHGFQTTGAPVAAILRGTIIMRDGVLTGTPGLGRLVPPGD